MKSYIVAIAVVLIVAGAVGEVRGTPVGTPALDTAAIASIMGRTGVSLPGDVYKIALPRSDLHVTVGDVVVRPGLALGGYAVFKAEPQGTLVAGDIPLLQAEIAPVRNSLESSGFVITALHNHLLNEQPHVMYMHFMKVGDGAQIAAALRHALALSHLPLGALRKPLDAPFPEASVLQQVLGRNGTVTGGVLAIGVPRAETVTMQNMQIPPAMGVATALNFESLGNGRVASTGDFVLTASEVGPVQSALASHGIEMTALHSHMLGDSPALYYMHFWAVGQARDVAAGLKAALGNANVASPR